MYIKSFRLKIFERKKKI